VAAAERAVIQKPGEQGRVRSNADNDAILYIAWNSEEFTPSLGRVALG
jgi:hypothetical protein